VPYDCAAPTAALAAKKTSAAASVLADMRYGAAASGSSASRGLFADAACSGLHAQPLRPASVIGPSKSGAADGCSAPASIDSTDAAPATPKAVPPITADRRALHRMARTQSLDIASSIAESLKNP
jgi:hypothetical protein